MLFTPNLPRFKTLLPVFVKLACELASVIFTNTYVTPFWIFWVARVIYWNEKTWLHLRKRVREIFLGLPFTRQSLTRNGGKNNRLLMCSNLSGNFRCNICSCTLGCKHQGEADIRRNVGGPQHLKKVKDINKMKSLSNYGFRKSSDPVREQVIIL